MPEIQPQPNFESTPPNLAPEPTVVIEDSALVIETGVNYARRVEKIKQILKHDKEINLNENASKQEILDFLNQQIEFYRQDVESWQIKLEAKIQEELDYKNAIAIKNKHWKVRIKLDKQVMLSPKKAVELAESQSKYQKRINLSNQLLDKLQAELAEIEQLDQLAA